MKNITLRTGSCPAAVFQLQQGSLVPSKTVVLISGTARDGPSLVGHTPEHMSNGEQQREHQGAKVGTKSRFPCFPATAFSSKKRAGNPQLAHKMWHMGNDTQGLRLPLVSQVGAVQEKLFPL